MQAASPTNIKTGMAAFTPLNPTQANALILEATKEHPESVLDIACINTNNNVVLSGDSKVLEIAGKLASEGFIGERVKFIPLNVSAPFHSRYMQPAEYGLFKMLESQVKTKISLVGVVSGLTNRPNRLVPGHLIEDFVPLTSGTVNFVGCIEQANNFLHTTETQAEAAKDEVIEPLWIEIGPKPTLKSFVSQTIPTAKVMSICNAEDVKKFLADNEMKAKWFPSSSTSSKKKSKLYA
jgi:malonyl CoA-acyl carrier protein transacylase